MIFNNNRLSYHSPEIEFFLWQIIGWELPNNFDLSIGENNLKRKQLKGSLLAYCLWNNVVTLLLIKSGPLTYFI